MPAQKHKAGGDSGQGNGLSRRRNTRASTDVRSTRARTTDAPRQAVFNTVELLENIFSHLPVKTLFGIQRVCRQFHELIAQSKQLQKRMFRNRPSHDYTPVRLVSMSIAPVHSNSLDQSGWSKVFRIPPEVQVPRDVEWSGNNPIAATGRATPRHAISVARFNPLLLGSTNSLSHRMEGGETRRLDMAPQPLLAARYGDGPSWRETYTADIPSSYVIIQIRWSVPGSKKKIEGWFRQRLQARHPGTLGSIFGDALDTTMDDFRYVHGKEIKEQKGRPRVIIKRLEKTARKVAVVECVKLQMLGVVSVSAGEEGLVEDWVSVAAAAAAASFNS
ncbi:hypothetical protein LTR62_008382 [Meristemomyces frigidus]|uniref:F-box domain-containing protein n=1 Tax=Meristemomyces frigidus TaxID=1508187 RepID=A0AAN7TI25_9PEZI|nr:hypothetical protein LTR62_008382 [Meristemomyces frigidus]